MTTANDETAEDNESGPHPGRTAISPRSLRPNASCMEVTHPTYDDQPLQPRISHPTGLSTTPPQPPTPY